MSSLRRATATTASSVSERHARTHDARTHARNVSYLLASTGERVDQRRLWRAETPRGAKKATFVTSLFLSLSFSVPSLSLLPPLSCLSLSASYQSFQYRRHTLLTALARLRRNARARDYATRDILNSQMYNARYLSAFLAFA